MTDDRPDITLRDYVDRQLTLLQCEIDRRFEAAKEDRDTRLAGVQREMDTRFETVNREMGTWETAHLELHEAELKASEGMRITTRWAVSTLPLLIAGMIGLVYFVIWISRGGH